MKAVGGVGSTERPQDRADVARFYAAASPGFVFNSAARQVSAAQGRSLSHNARALALLNMAINDSLVASFDNKYRYNYWRPETAIRAGDTDGNPRTDPDTAFAPFIPTPCFPSYPSNHASGSYGGAEVLERIYGAGRHAPMTLSNPTLGLTLHVHQVQADHRRHRRRARVRRDPLPIRSGGRRPARTRGRGGRLPAQPAARSPSRSRSRGRLQRSPLVVRPPGTGLRAR